MQSPWAEGTWNVASYSPPSFPRATVTGSPNYAYTGPLTGTLSAGLSGGQILKIYSVTDQAYEQLTLTVVGTSWSLTNVNVGYKVAVVWDSTNRCLSSTEFAVCNDPHYQIKTYLVTDQEYLQFEVPAQANNTWLTSPLFIDYLHPVSDLSTVPLIADPGLGPYTAKLYLEPSDTFLATTILLDGLVRSYKVSPSDHNYSILHNRSYCYDQALSIIASLAYSDTVFTDRLVSGLIKSQSTASGHVGQWYFSVDAYTAVPPDPYYRSGAQAYCILALCLYLKVRGSSQYGSQVTDAINAGCAALLAYQQPPGPQGGLIRLGFGEYIDDVFVPGVGGFVSNCSTEHNLDSYFALQAANVIIPGMGYGTAATAVAAGVSTLLWGHAIYGYASFVQGILPDGTLDTANALDINSLGALFWEAHSNLANAHTAINAAQAFYYRLSLSQGYAPYIPTQGYPGALANVWPEGTWYLALAAQRAGISNTGFNDLCRGIAPLRGGDGGWQYCAVNDDLYELGTYEGISGTALAIIVLTPAIRDKFFVDIT